VLIEEKETLRSPDVTIRWIRNVEGVGRGVEYCADLPGNPTTPQM